MHYQEINEILAKAVKKEYMSTECAREITAANDYLLNCSGVKPDWIEGFLESNRCKLVETICRATSVQQGISSIQGYSEGYFYEIVQNANDLHCGDYIEIRTQKNGEVYRLVCDYKDRGFELSNIYAFLNREMSDKVGDGSQTGKFGVGIKSFFKFVNSLKIVSNVLFDFRISRDSENCAISGVTEINQDWNGESTSLEIEYQETNACEFNTKKLTALIDYLNGDKLCDSLKFFITGTDSEIVFDIRSLIFMRLKSRFNKNISRLLFKGSVHEIVILCEETEEEKVINYEEEKWKTGIVEILMSVDGTAHYQKSFIYFTNGEISSAFPLGEISEIKNRMYSTYYLKEDTRQQLFPCESLFDTPYANIHRNDVGNSEESINQVYEKARNHMKSLYAVMCSRDAAGLKFALQISDVYHNFVARYLMVDRNKFTESPLNFPYCNNAFLPKMNEASAKMYIVVHRDQEEYDLASYQERNIVRELRESYFEFVEKGNVYDLKQLLSNKNCVSGVKNVFTLIASQREDIPPDNYLIASVILNYFASVAEYISYDVSKRRYSEAAVTDSEIDLWLITLRERIGNYFNPVIFLKLIGRYKLNPAVAYDGTVIRGNLSFRDYLFNSVLIREDGVLSRLQNQQYDERYASLKRGLLKERYVDPGNTQDIFMIRCIRPVSRSLAGWDGLYDYYEMEPPGNKSGPIADLDLLLEKMAMDSSFTSLCYDESGLKLYEKYSRGMRMRRSCFKQSVIDYQQIIDLSCMRNIRLKKFTRFVKAVKHRAMLNEEWKGFIKISCIEDRISTTDIIHDVLPVIVGMPEKDYNINVLDEYAPGDVEIRNIEENSNNELPKEYIKFVFQMTGLNMHVYRFISGTRRRMISYFGNGICAVRTDMTKKFREVGEYPSKDKDVFVFYDNYYDNIQDIVISVLEEFGLSARRLELMEGYINNRNSTKTMNYLAGRRNLAKIKRKLSLDWADIRAYELNEITDNEILYRLLTARGSYDIFCPICADIPLEASNYEEDSKKRRSRRIVLMENSNTDTNETIPYIITVACENCCRKLKNTLLKAEFDGRNIIVTTQIAQGTHEKMRSKKQIEMSPINIALMKAFRI